MLLYIDSLFGEGRQREVKPLHSIPETLNQLYLLAMREHARDGVLLQGAGDEWTPTPDWRFDRHVIRVAVYGKERLGLDAGRRVAIISELRPEWLLVDFAAVGLGAISVAIPPDLSTEAMAAALQDASPHAVFFSRSVREKMTALRGRLPDTHAWIAFDGSASAQRPAHEVDFEHVLELGGTLDTPERAQVFRAGAREAAPEEIVLRHYRETEDDLPSYEELTQGDVIDQLKGGWAVQSAQPGDLVYMLGGTVTLDLRLALYSFLGDGYSMVALGNPGREAEEISRLRPHKIIASSKSLESVLQKNRARSRGRADTSSGWRQLAERLTPQSRQRRARKAIIEGLGGRARWVGPTTPLDPVLSAQLSSAVAVGTLGVGVAHPV